MKTLEGEKSASFLSPFFLPFPYYLGVKYEKQSLLTSTGKLDFFSSDLLTFYVTLKIIICN